MSLEVYMIAATSGVYMSPAGGIFKVYKSRSAALKKCRELNEQRPDSSPAYKVLQADNWHDLED